MFAGKKKSNVAPTDTKRNTSSVNSGRISFGSGAKQTLTMTADVIPDGVKESIRQGLLLRVEAGHELKLLALWGIEREDEVGASVVIRDGHTLKKKVSWRPSSVGGEQLHATSIVFVPAHQYGTTRADGTMWTSWFSPAERAYHQFVLFNPLNREAQRCLKFREIFQNSSVGALYAPRGQKEVERGVKFASERGSIVQPPLATFLEPTQRVFLLHQIESRGVLEAAVSAIIPCSPFTVVETCILQFSWSSTTPFVAMRSTNEASIGSLVVLVTERLHSVILRATATELQIGRTFRPRDFLGVAQTPADAAEVSIRWFVAEIREHVILPEYFRDPNSEKAISEPIRFGLSAALTTTTKPPQSSTASQRSSSMASTVAQRVGGLSTRGASVETRQGGGDQYSLTQHHHHPIPDKSSDTMIAPPSAKVVARAVEVLERLQHTTLRSQYFRRWVTKILKQPNWCIDGWPADTHTAVIIAPITLLLGAEHPSHISNFLNCCRASHVELWLLYEESFDLLQVMDRLKSLDAQHTIGQLIAVPSLRDVAAARQNMYLRHLHHHRVLWIMPSVSWMLHASPMGRKGESDLFAPCTHQILFGHKQTSSYFLNRLGELVHGCRRLTVGRAFEHLWTSMGEPELRPLLKRSKECGPNGKGFVDLVTL